MIATRLLRALGGTLGLCRPLILEDLPSPTETQSIIQRERQRADRTQGQLTLLTFRPPAGAATSRYLSTLVALLQRRLRNTDELGWLDGDTLAAILPHTGLEGASKVHQDVCASLPEGQSQPQCQVYLYPHPPGDSHRLDESRAESQTPVASLEPLLAQPISLFKRTIDILVAAIALLLLLPLLLVVALLVRLTSPGPIFFCQWRSGRGGRPFLMFKFRTMSVDAESRQAELRARSEQDGPAFKLKHDPRVTSLGRFLRKTSLDELPQLWNVLIGDMSLVGPRPLPCQETASCEPWHRQRLMVVPGLTCIWQVEGRSRVSFAEWMRMDLQYVRSRSVQQDLKLLLLTVPAVLLQKGAQ